MSAEDLDNWIREMKANIIRLQDYVKPELEQRAEAVVQACLARLEHLRKEK